jgi:methylmalonyl-CoA mutase N-terminal domain/subunit
MDGGLQVDDFAPRLSFFFAAHTDLFEEAAKFRAARRIYARLMRDRFGATDASCRLRFHTQTGGVTLTAQTPLNNVVRVTIQALAAALGGTQSLHTNGYDEALSLPTREAATLALRTQQVVAHESGIANTVDPLAGSYFVEWLTDELERRALALMSRIEELGGAARAIESGFLHEEIARSAYAHQMRVESGEATIVGVNRFVDSSDPVSVPRPDYSRLESDQVARLAARRQARADVPVAESLNRVRDRARAYRDDAQAGDRPSLMPAIIDAVRARATVGEIADALREEWGAFVPA